MFDIEYKGGNTVVITSKQAKIVLDPKQSLIGLSDFKLADGIQLATEERFVVEDKSYSLVFDGPGEYEMSGVAVRGVPMQRHIDSKEQGNQATSYRLLFDGTRIAVLGNISPDLSEDQLEAIGVVDIAIIPIGGGGYTLDATSASALIRQLEPKVVIPIHYADEALGYEVPQDGLETFVSELGAPVEDAGKKYKVKTVSSLPQTLTVVTIERS